MHKAKTRTRIDVTRYTDQTSVCKGFVRSTTLTYTVSMTSKRKNVLFVCSRNQWRSPTAERLYRKDQRLNVRSAGVSSAARRRISDQDINWADIVIAMDASHADRLRPIMRRVKSKTELHTLDIPDLYQFMDPELIDIIRDRLEPILS